LPWSFATSRLGTAGLTGFGDPTRPLRSFALLESPFSDSDRHPGQGTVNRSVLSWTFSPLELAPAVCGSGMRADERRSGRTRALMRPRDPLTWPRVFARSRIRSWGLEPTIRRRHRSIEPVRRRRQAANLLASGFAFRPPAVRQPRARDSPGSREAPELARARDVLPAPPLGGAPRLRPFVRARPHEAVASDGPRRRSIL